MPWTVSRNAVNQELYAHISCPKCKQTVEGTNPDVVFRHCGGKVEFLTIPQRELLLSADPNAEEKQHAQNFAALEAAKNQQLPAYFNEAEAFAREAAAMRRDADALEAKRREQYEYDMRTPLPRQPTGETPQRERYEPNVKDV